MVTAGNGYDKITHDIVRAMIPSRPQVGYDD